MRLRRRIEAMGYGSAVAEATDQELPAWRRAQKRRKRPARKPQSARAKIRAGLDRERVGMAFDLATSMLRDGQSVQETARELKTVVGSSRAAEAVVQIAALSLRAG